MLASDTITTIPRTIQREGCKKIRGLFACLSVVLVDPAQILAAAHSRNPFAVLQVPDDRLPQPCAEGFARSPLELGLELAGVDGVAPVVPRPVLDEGDEFPPGAAARPGADLVEDVTDAVDDGDILLLGVAAYVVGLAAPPLVHDRPDGLAVVLHVEPVADVLPVAVDGKGLALQGIEGDQRDELLRELPGAVVVGAVGDRHGQPVGLEIGPHQVVRGCLGGAVGAVGLVGHRLGEETFLSKASVDLVGAHVVKETEAICVAARRLEKVKGAHDVREDELGGPLDGAVHVALGGEVAHGVDAVVGEDRVYPLEVADVLPQKDVAAGIALFEVPQILRVAGVGQLVDIHDPPRKA